LGGTVKKIANYFDKQDPIFIQILKVGTKNPKINNAMQVILQKPPVLHQEKKIPTNIQIAEAINYIIGKNVAAFTLFVEQYSIDFKTSGNIYYHVADNKKASFSFYIAACGHPKFIALLFDKNNINQYDEKGYTVLHYAANEASEIFLDELLKMGANPNILDEEGKYTPLHFAVDNCNLTIIEKLFAHNADPLLPDHGSSAWGWAIRYGYKEISKLFLEKKQKPKLLFKFEALVNIHQEFQESKNDSEHREKQTEFLNKLREFNPAELKTPIFKDFWQEISNLSNNILNYGNGICNDVANFMRLENEYLLKTSSRLRF